MRGETLLERYTRLAETVAGVMRVGWLDRLQQAVQFEILLELQIGPTASVLDAGCGTGDLLALLDRRGFQGSYTGLDWMPAFITEASSRFADRPRTHFLTLDLLAETPASSDFVLASGLFDYKSSSDLDDTDRWEKQIIRLFEATRLAFAWNGYSQLPPGRDDMWAIALSRVVDLCQRLSPFWRLRADYAVGHYTAFLYRRDYWLTPALQTLIGHLFLDRTLITQLQHDPYAFADQYGLSMQQLNLLSSLADSDIVPRKS